MRSRRQKKRGQKKIGNKEREMLRRKGNEKTIGRLTTKKRGMKENEEKKSARQQ